MLIDILQTIGIFFFSFLFNPILYIGMLVIYFLARKRVQEERQSFHTKVFKEVADFSIPFLPALLAGVYVSIVTIALGIVISWEWVAALAVVYLLLLVTRQIQWLTSTFALGLLLLFYGMEPLLVHVDVFTPIYAELTQIPLQAVASLLVLLMLAEGFLIRFNGATYTSPRLERSKRGKWIGLHVSKRLWIVPIVLFLPDGIIPTIPYWPTLSMGEMTLQPVFIPFLIGFHQRVKGSIPSLPVKATGVRVIGLSLFMVIFAIGSFFVPILAVVLGGLAIVGREWLSYQAKVREEKQPIYFATQAKGCIILGVLPNSPAEKMKLAIGEKIVKINGRAVNNETTFYEALQINSAYCKLEVLNHDGEIRFAQGALYDGEHHQLGVLLVKDDVVLQDSIT
ncbi:PDZ domain-containing protein [Halalkalibacter alkalisediminis]|uniref:PDZ domain-containing protein n=1 Tax=Halalkalibacter alkalisediminis TaxID=935616 RepID=A0ABV6NGP7_9BACI|nr:PDZ domain-containing protein [Halalkalibacter alkalisediminis]